MNVRSARHRLATLASLCAITIAGTLTGCRSDDNPRLPDKPTTTATEQDPSVSPSASSSASAPPSANGTTPPSTGVDLDRAQQSAYDNALEDYNEVQRVVRALNANPAPDQATANQLKRVTYNPASDQFFASIQRYARAKVRVVGQREVLWRAPVRVDLGARPRATVVWRQCLALGTTQVIYGASPIPQKDDRTIGEVTALTDENGFWKVSNVQSKGAC